MPWEHDSDADMRPARRSLRIALTAVAAGLVLLGLLAFARADTQPDARQITWKECAGGGTAATITAGGTAQNYPATTVPQPLRGFFIQNPSTATESLFFDPTGTASTTAGVSGELTAGQSVSFGPGTLFTGAMSFNAATSAHAFTCWYGQ